MSRTTSAPHQLRTKPSIMRTPGLHSIADTSAKLHTLKLERFGQPIGQERIHANTMPGGYTHPELTQPPARTNAPRVHLLPSRVGNTLRYPDGRITDLHGNPQEA